MSMDDDVKRITQETVGQALAGLQQRISELESGGKLSVNDINTIRQMKVRYDEILKTLHSQGDTARKVTEVLDSLNNAARDARPEIGLPPDPFSDPTGRAAGLSAGAGVLLALAEQFAAHNQWAAIVLGVLSVAGGFAYTLQHGSRRKAVTKAQGEVLSARAAGAATSGPGELSVDLGYQTGPQDPEATYSGHDEAVPVGDVEAG